MNPMKLIGSPTSPYARKVRIVLAEKNLAAEFVIDLPWSPQTTVPLFNPLGKVPVLVRDDGSTLFDSRVIVEYLDFLAPLPAIYGSTPGNRIHIKRWEALADGASDAAAAIVIENRRVETERSAGWIARQHGKLDAAIAAMAADLGTRSWCVGDQYSLADIALVCALGFVTFRLPQIDWRAKHPHMAQWFDRVSTREAFAATVPRE